MCSLRQNNTLTAGNLTLKLQNSNQSSRYTGLGQSGLEERGLGKDQNQSLNHNLRPKRDVDEILHYGSKKKNCSKMGGFSKTGADFTLSRFFLLKQESRYLHKPNSLISDHCRLVVELLFLAVRL